MKVFYMGCGRWSLIAGRLPGRTDNEVKNYWNSHISKKLIKMGIDPNNHRLNQNHVQAAIANKLSSPPQTDNQSGSTNHIACKTTLKSAGENSNNYRRPAESDAASCLEDETSAAASSGHLNLDLTIAFPIHDHDDDRLIKLVEDVKPHNNESLKAREMESSNNIHTLPTLTFFR